MSKKITTNFGSLIFVFLEFHSRAIVMWIFGYDAIWGHEELFYTALVVWCGLYLPCYGSSGLDWSWFC